jgi:malate synthase
LVPVAKEIFDEYMKTPNQIGLQRPLVNIQAADLLAVPKGDITEDGLRLNVDVGLRYLASWLAGNGCVPIYNLMEDAATAEICRAQVWQWVKHNAKMNDGRVVDAAFVKRVIAEQTEKIRQELGTEAFAKTKFPKAQLLYEQMMTEGDFPEFLTLGAYDNID